MIPTISIICLLFYLFLGWRLILPAQLDLPWSILAGITLAIPFIMLPSGFILRARRSGPLVDAFSWVSYICMGLLALLLSLTLARDLLWMVALGIDALLNLFDLAWRLLPADPEHRARLLTHTSAGIATVALASAAYGLYQARRSPRIRAVTIPVPNLHSGLEGFRIAQLSDIHLGPTIKGPFFQRAVGAVNTLNADLVAITGDLIDGYLHDLAEDVAPITDLKSRYGTFFVTGNHEYYWDAAAWSDHIASLGIPVLANAHRVIEHEGARLLIAGVNDHSAGRILSSHASDPHKALHGAPHADFKLLLAHQPNSVFEAAKAGFDLQLSGHTHGGQFYPWHLIVRLGNPFVAGLHTFEEMMIYISNGTGYWGPPLRLGAPSEITLLTLTAKA